MGRWLGPRIHRQVAERVHRTLTGLRSSVPPRVMAALLRTLWNGWCTARRFQQRAACPFCLAEASDELEHMPFCRTVREVGRSG